MNQVISHRHPEVEKNKEPRRRGERGKGGINAKTQDQSRGNKKELERGRGENRFILYGLEVASCSEGGGQKRRNRHIGTAGTQKGL